MKTPELPARRRIERRELITLFNSLAPGETITAAEVQMRTGVDVRMSGDRSLSYDVREHCRDVLGFVIVYRDSVFTRIDDEGVVKGVLPKRRERIFRQAKRGVAESMAIQDFAALPRVDQLRLLTYQSIMGTLALASHREAPKLVDEAISRIPKLVAIDPDAVVAAVKSIRQ